MCLPLVKQVMDLFDATIVEVRAENAALTQSSASESADTTGNDTPAQRPSVTSVPTDGFADGQAMEDSPFMEEDDNV